MFSVFVFALMLVLAGMGLWSTWFRRGGIYYTLWRTAGLSFISLGVVVIIKVMGMVLEIMVNMSKTVANSKEASVVINWTNILWVALGMAVACFGYKLTLRFAEKYAIKRKEEERG